MYMQALGASERVFELLDRQPRMGQAGKQTPHGRPEGGAVEFDNVWYALTPALVRLIAMSSPSTCAACVAVYNLLWCVTLTFPQDMVIYQGSAWSRMETS